MSLDSIGNRMKLYYETIYSSIRFPMRMPLCIRIDGKTFSNLTKTCKKPFDDNFVALMQETAIYLCENIQGAQIAYVQSDEISILVHNYKRFDSQPYLNNELEKIISITAGMASSYFSINSGKVFNDQQKLAVFDSRAFVLPEAEVNNYFLWRQQDSTRNSISMLARSLYSHKDCLGKNKNELQEMCFQKGYNWNDLPTHLKRGSCVIKDYYFKEIDDKTIVRSKWIIDNNIPIFSQNKDYINNLLSVEEE